MIVQADELFELEKTWFLDIMPGVSRIAWLLRYNCDICERPMEAVFSENPSETYILETILCPCHKCIGKFNRHESYTC